MRIGIYVLIGVLAILHQDFWYWNDATLVFGFLPIGLAYHLGYSVAAAGAWALAIKFAWPQDVEDFGEELIQEPPQ